MYEQNRLRVALLFSKIVNETLIVNQFSDHPTLTNSQLHLIAALGLKAGQTPIGFLILQVLPCF